jgi:hypothetical protein
MRGIRLHLLVALGLVAWLAAACAGDQTPTPSESGQVGSYDEFVAAVRLAGATAEPAGTVSQAFFGPEGQVVKINGQDVQVFEFPGDQEVNAAVQSISQDGSSIGTSMVTWVAAPHFYKGGRLIVLYVGEDGGVIEVLDQVLGSQFAGR